MMSRLGVCAVSRGAGVYMRGQDAAVDGEGRVQRPSESRPVRRSPYVSLDSLHQKITAPHRVRFRHRED